MQGIIRSLVVLTVAVTLSACSIFGGGDKEKAKVGPQPTTIGINGYLWQAALDTLSFMPLETVEPNGGLIVTGWHSTAAAPSERVKVTVQFRTKELRSDGVKVFVVRQEKTDGNWLSVPVQASTELQLEEAILMAARRMRVAAEE